MSATRLPGKVLYPVGGQPALQFLVERLKRVKGVDAIVIATTTNPVDGVIEAWGRARGVEVFRGSEDDVMGRVLGAAHSVDAERIVELTGDNPLIDPGIIERALGIHDAGNADYVSNVMERTYPLGMDTQVISTWALEDAYRRTNDPVDREHVSLFIYRNPKLYKLQNFVAPPEHTWPELRLTLDTAVDHDVIDDCARGLASFADYGLSEVIGYMRARPELVAHNAVVAHRWV